MFVTAAIMAGAAVYSAQEGKKAASDQRKAARAQAGAILAQGAEERRRMLRGQRRQVSSAVAASHASGIMMSGSNERYIQDMQDEMAREAAWHRRATHASADAALRGGSLQASATNAQATASGIQGLTGAINQGWSDYRGYRERQGIS